jgi:hypothetical protein
MHSACVVIQNLLKNAKVGDPSQDILKTSSLPTLLLNQLKVLQKQPANDNAELIADVLHTTAELSKIFYTKAQGTDPIFMKHLIP